MVEENIIDTSNSNKRILYLDLLRIFSIFCMMVLHVSASEWYVTPVVSFEWQVFNIYDSLVRFCVPVFVMISGVFFLDITMEYTVKKLFEKNILRIIIAFIFWSASYAILSNLLKCKTVNMDVLLKIFKSFLNGHYHLWFLFILVGLYMITPFLRKICESKILMQYFLTLSFIFTYVVNLLSLVPAFGSLITIGMDKVNMFFVMGFSGYFILGYYLTKYQLPKKIKLLIYILGITAVIVTITMTSFLSVKNGEPCSVLYGNLLPNTFFTSSAVFLFFKEKISTLKFSTTQINFIQKLSKLTFGMYLVHDFFNVLFTKFLNFTTLSFNPVFSVPIISIFVFILSFFVILIINKIPILKKYII